MLYTFESVFIFFVEVHFRSHKKFLSENDLILVREFEGRFICELVVRN